MAEVNLQSFNNSWYKPGGSLIGRLLWFVLNSLILKSMLPGSFWRRALLRLFGAKIGKMVILKPRISVKYPWNLSIGDHSWLGEKVWIDNLGKVSIGSHCCISQGAILICGNHNYKKSSFDLMVKPIIIMNGAWVGAASAIAPGTEMGKNCVLSIGSTAVGLLEPNAIYQGNPAVKIKDRVIG